MKLFTECLVDGVKCGPDGMRCDVDGNLWVSSNAGRAVGYNGVTVWNPEGKPSAASACRRSAAYLLRRSEAQPAVYGREPIDLRGLYGNTGRGSRLSSVEPQPLGQPPG